MNESKEDKIRAEFHESMGKTLSLWQIAEFFLFDTLCFILHPAERNIISAAFFSVPSFEARLRMVENAGRELTRDNEEVMEDFLKVMKTCSKVNQSRNDLVHLMALFDTDKKEMSLSVPVFNQARLNSGRGKTALKMHDIIGLQARIIQLTNDLQSIAGRIYEYKDSLKLPKQSS